MKSLTLMMSPTPGLIAEATGNRVLLRMPETDKGQKLLLTRDEAKQLRNWLTSHLKQWPLK